MLVPMIVQIGVGGARVIGATKHRIDYIDEGGHERFVDLDHCRQNSVKTPVGKRVPYVAWHGMDYYPGGRFWIQFYDKGQTRFQFQTQFAKLDLLIELFGLGCPVFDST